MRTTNNTVLITGGSAGIGFAIAKALVDQGNKVIITGRNRERLDKAAAALGGATAIAMDVSRPADIDALAERIRTEFPDLNIVINNAGNAYAYEMGIGTETAIKAADEMQTNFFAVLHLNEQLLPLLQQQPEAAIVHVTSIVAIAPNHNLPTYSASKAALHSYSLSLRHTLAKNSPVKVFELMPPLVNTEFSKPIGGERGIAPEAVAGDLLDALAGNRYEIRTGATADLYALYLSSPEAAFDTMNNRSEAVK